MNEKKYRKTRIIYLICYYFFNFIRIDIYTNNKEIFVGEIIHGGATEKFLPIGYFSEIQFDFYFKFIILILTLMIIKKQ